MNERHVKDGFGSPEPLKTEPDFNTWFRGSKIVDDSGEPLIVYHGTAEDFEVFDVELNYEQAAYFTPNPQTASSFAECNGSDEGGRVIPVYLSIHNPKIVSLEHADYQYDQGLLKREFDLARSEGHDGVILRGVTEIGGCDDQYVAFSPQQIRFAFHKDCGESDVDSAEQVPARQVASPRFKG